MPSHAPLKSYCAAHANDFQLQIESIDDLTVTTYSRGTESYQTQAFLVADPLAYRQIFKRSRDPIAHAKLLQQSRQLEQTLDAPSFKSLSPRVILGLPCNIANETLLRFRYQPSQTLYRKLRTSVTNNSVRSAAKLALDLCADLQHSGNQADNPAESVDQIIDDYCKAHRTASRDKSATLRQAICGNYPSAATTVVHNDLGASNLLQEGQHHWLIDWEYWRWNLSIFNFFDVMINFGSLLSTSYGARRTHQTYCKIFTAPPKRRMRVFNEMLHEYAVTLGYQSIPPETAYSLYHLFLMNKACCQHRVYGGSYCFDQFWKQHCDWASNNRQHFIHYWHAHIASPSTSQAKAA